MKEMSQNPLFLSLLCTYQIEHHSFPPSSHGVFESFISSRLARDAEWLESYLSVTTKDVRRLAEEIAFAMTAEIALGLSPPKERLISAVIGGDSTKEILTRKVIDALISLKFLRLELFNDQLSGESKEHVTFVHRRFQEYFATCHVLTHSNIVPSVELMTEGRWRETAVTILQTQTREA